MAQQATGRALERRTRGTAAFESWKAAILKNARAGEALTAMLRANLSGSVLGTQARLDTLLGYAYYYVSGRSLPWLSAAVMKGRELHDKIAAMAAAMKEISQVAGELEDWEVWFLQVPEQVAASAEALAAEWSGIAEYGRKRLAEPDLDHEFQLALLLHYVKTVTGKSHYKELAILLREAAGLLGTKHARDEKALRAHYAAYLERFPLVLDACLALW